MPRTLLTFDEVCELNYQSMEAGVGNTEAQEICWKATKNLLEEIEYLNNKVRVAAKSARYKCYAVINEHMNNNTSYGDEVNLCYRLLEKIQELDNE